MEGAIEGWDIEERETGNREGERETGNREGERDR